MTRSPVTVGNDLGVLTKRIRALRAAQVDVAGEPGRRTIIGLAGPPGAGKSTLADALVEALRTAGTPAVGVGLDGFHLAQRVLVDRGLVDVKGAPETFDAGGYVALLRRLRAVPREYVYAPAFERALEEPVAGAIPVPPETDVIVTEGNYLLLPSPPWNAIRPLLDETWYLDVAEEIRVRRLTDRHVRFGRAADAAYLRATTGSDGVNALLVAASRSRADVIVTGAAGRKPAYPTPPRES